MLLRSDYLLSLRKKAKKVLSKLLATLIELFANFSKAIPTIAKNQSMRLKIKKPAKIERAKLRAIRLKRRQIRAERKLRKREKKRDK